MRSLFRVLASSYYDIIAISKRMFRRVREQQMQEEEAKGREEDVKGNDPQELDDEEDCLEQQMQEATAREEDVQGDDP